MILMNNLEKAQRGLVDLLAFARAHGELKQGDGVNALLGLFQKAQEQELTREEMTRLTRLTQDLVVLPNYTTNQAAAFLGITLEGVRYALYMADPPLLKGYKPGHDVLIPHEEVARYAQERRYRGAERS